MRPWMALALMGPGRAVAHRTPGYLGKMASG